MVLLDEFEDISLLRHFSPVYQMQIASMAEPQAYQTGDCIFREGQNERQVYLVVKGEVALEIKVPEIGVVQVHRVGPGDLLGWSPVLGRGSMTATARALSACRLLALDAERIRTLAERDTRFGMEFFRSMSIALAERLRATRLQLPDPRLRPMLGMCEGAD
jgi:CRP/FNR family transcriptional regulator, cyclic AMP receptor protein